MSGKHHGERRNYAILLLLARLGLRACEIVALEINDIDWDNACITIRGKGGRLAQMPLPIDVDELNQPVDSDSQFDNLLSASNAQHILSTILHEQLFDLLQAKISSSFVVDRFDLVEWFETGF